MALKMTAPHRELVAQMIRPVTVLVLGLLLFACAAPVPIRLPEDRPSKEELVLQLNLGGSEFRTIRGLAKGSYRQAGQRKSASQVVLAQYPDKLRLETLGLFGAPLLLAATDGRMATALLPGEGRAFVGTSDSDFISRFFRLPLSVETIVAMILLRTELIVWQQTAIQHLDDGVSRLILTAGSMTQEVDFNPERQIVRMARFSDGRLQSSLHYAAFSDGFPAHIELQIPQEDIMVSLDFSEIELNIDHKEGVFRLVPPPEYRVEPMPQS